MTLKEELDNQRKELLDDNIIRPLKSPSNSPMWIISKKMDSSCQKIHGMVVGYRKLNKITMPDKYPISEIKDVLTYRSKHRYFPKRGFHQISLTPSYIQQSVL